VQQWSGGIRFHDGPALYFRTYPLAAAASVALLPFAPLAFSAPRPACRAALLLAVYAAASFVVYAVLNPPPYHWYFLQQTVPIALLGAFGIAAAERRFGRRALLLGGIPLILLGLMRTSASYPRNEPWIDTNWGTETQYEVIARDIDASTHTGDAIEMHGEIGTLAFFSERYYVNEFSDVGRTNWLIRHAAYQDTPALAALLRLNSMWRGNEPMDTSATWRLTQEPPSSSAPAPAGIGTSPRAGRRTHA